MHLGFKSDFDLPAFLAQTGLRAASIEKVNVPRIWSLVICQNAGMSRLSDYQTFLTQFLRNYSTTGSVIPSGRALGDALVPACGTAAAPQKILEAGPGTGAVTGMHHRSHGTG